MRVCACARARFGVLQWSEYIRDLVGRRFESFAVISLGKKLTHSPVFVSMRRDSQQVHLSL